jgi:hypothetical protein
MGLPVNSLPAQPSFLLDSESTPLCPECRFVASATGRERIGVKAASNFMLALLANIKFLGLGMLGVGLMYVYAPQVIPPTFWQQRSPGESLLVDDEQATIPMILLATSAVQTDPNPGGIQANGSGTVLVPPPGTKRPQPPPQICIGRNCVTTPNPSTAEP